MIAHEKESTGEGENLPRAPASLPSSTVPSAGPVDVQNGNRTSRVTEESNGLRKRKFTSDKEFDEPHEEVAYR